MAVEVARETDPDNADPALVQIGSDFFAGLIATGGPGQIADGGDLPVDWRSRSALLPAYSSLSRFASAGASKISVQSAIRIVDIIPFASSAEALQDFAPSLAVNPLDPSQIIASFSNAIRLATEYYLSTDAAVTWALYDTLDTVGQSLAWTADGAGFLTSTLTFRSPLFTDIKTYSGTVAGGDFHKPINVFAPQTNDFLNQPWIRIGPSNHVYVAYNNLNESVFFGGPGKTASVNVSTDGGVSFTAIVVERVAAGVGQDAPAVRLAVNGNTVYAAFTRWNAVIEDDTDGKRYAAEVVVVRSDNGGADAFTALGTGGAGTVVGTPTGVQAFIGRNTPLTLGQQRATSDIAIAVDPNDPRHLVIAYTDAPGPDHSGQVQLIVAASTDGGVNWTTKFVTSATTRSGQAALAIQADGTIGFLYNNYDPATDTLSQHLLQTDDHFLTVSDTLLGRESNAAPVGPISPYLGDFFDLAAVGNSFYGVFSASNADNGIDAQFSDVTFQRSFTGAPGTASFQLTDGSGNPVAASIDPFFFVVSDAPAEPPGARDFNADGRSDILWQNDNGSVAQWQLSGTAVIGGGPMGAADSSWHIRGTGDFNGDGRSDVLWRNDNGFVLAWEMDGTAIIGGGGIGSADPSWHIRGTGDFNGDGRSDILWQNDDGSVVQWQLNGTAIIGGGLMDAADPIRHVRGIGDFNADGRSDVLWQDDNGIVGLWEMDGTAITGGGSVAFADPSWHISGTGDFNGDGASDILWQNDDGSVGQWQLNGTAVIGGGLMGGADPSWHIRGTGDFNGDGRSDVLWQHDSGLVLTWEMDGTVLIGGGGIGSADASWHIIPSDPAGAAASSAGFGFADLDYAPTPMGSRSFDRGGISSAVRPDADPTGSWSEIGPLMAAEPFVILDAGAG